ncbi:hypothetical protein I4U23_014755 [Adineta vaga]|nr:hypothetical protein I4U23_014755 [Adineta vaga]
MVSTSTEDDYAKENYGIRSYIQCQEQLSHSLVSMRDINETLLGQVIWIRSRIHLIRNHGKRAFITLRSQTETMTAVLSVNEDVSKSMIKFVANTTRESIVDVEGEVANNPVSTELNTQKNLELHVKKFFIVNYATFCPVFFEEDQRKSLHNIFTQYNNRVTDLRTPVPQAIFRIQAGICKLFHEILDAKGFIEIHTPKILFAPSERNKNVFYMPYFDSKVYLAPSSQFHTQMAIAADFEKVYTIGTAFRYFGGRTRRHLTEFIGLNLEMSFQYHYHEVLDILGDLFVQIFEELTQRFTKEMEILKLYNCKPFQYLKPTLRLEFQDAIKLLAKNETGTFFNDELNVLEQEKLGQIVRTKYHTDFYILNKYPLSNQAFYTMPDPQNATLSNSYQMFMRGEEILSGSQRIHDVYLLLERVKHHHIDTDEIRSYIEAFRYGCAPHAGAKIGLERVVMGYLGVRNIRDVSMFPRDSHHFMPS